VKKRSVLGRSIYTLSDTMVGISDSHAMIFLFIIFGRVGANLIAAADSVLKSILFIRLCLLLVHVYLLKDTRMSLGAHVITASLFRKVSG
jgi:hypothetical protein